MLVFFVRGYYLLDILAAGLPWHIFSLIFFDKSCQTALWPMWYANLWGWLYSALLLLQYGMKRLSHARSSLKENDNVSIKVHSLVVVCKPWHVSQWPRCSLEKGLKSCCWRSRSWTRNCVRYDCDFCLCISLCNVHTKGLVTLSVSFIFLHQRS